MSQAATRIPTLVCATGRASHTVREGWLGSSSETYEYDVYGNMTTYNGTPIPIAETGGVPNNRLAAGSYNDRGSLTAHDGFTFVWDALDQMRGMTSSTLHRSFAYDAAGERVFIRENAQDRFTLRGLDAKLLREIRRSLGQLTWEKDLVWRGGVLLATVGAEEGITHVHVDHLGSTRLLTDRCGQAVATFDLYPFGKTLGDSPQHPQRMRFTGHERDLNARNDDTDDFDYMHARYYGPKLARFLTIDPGRDNVPSQPQSWNLYAYTRGNPMNYVDPTGKVTLVFTVGPGQDLFEKFGHSAAYFSTPGVPGKGISLEGNHHFEAGLFNFVESYLGEGRDIYISFLATTPTQDAASISFLKDNPNGAVNSDAFLAGSMIRENCAQAVGNALEAGGVFPEGSNPSQIPGAVASLPHMLALRVMTHPQHVETIRIPSGTSAEKVKEYLGIIIRSVGNELDAR